MKDRDKVIYMLAFAALVVALFFLLRKHGASVLPASSTTTTTTQTVAPSTQPGMFYPPSALSLPDIPVSSINVSYTPASNTNQPTGYVPLFGFIGYGGQWA